MKRVVYSAIVFVGVALCAVVLPSAVGQPPEVPVRPRQPGGLLGDQLGKYLTIEGVLYDGKGKVESNTLMVDTVNGKKLDKPVGVVIRNVDNLPVKERCVLKGYESGAMIGTPPAIRDAAEEQGQEYVERSAAGWQWRPYFVVLIAVEPKGLILRKQ